MAILYDSKMIEHKDPFGCVKQDELCSLCIHIPRRHAAKAVYICIESHHGFYAEYPMEWSDLEDGYDYYSGGFSLEYCDLYYYYFKIITEKEEFLLFKKGYDETQIGSGEKWQLTCYNKNYDTPHVFKGRVMYQIFPDRFHRDGECDLTDKLKPYYLHKDMNDIPVYLPDYSGEIKNNDFFGGNLKGIEARLQYLKRLHVSIIYLNPIFMAYSNHRYDTADYKRIDPMLGTEQDFIDLCHAAHKLDMKIILDGVFSHTGSNSIYFDKENVFGKGAYHNLSSPYSSWFHFDEYPNRYTSWWGIQTLPCVNELEPSYIDYILENDDSVVRYWMRLGADGYRLDVADELPDEFIQKLHRVVKEEKEDSLVIGEVWEDASNKEAYGIKRKYFTHSELDSVMNYPYKNAIISFIKGESSSVDLANTVMTIAENYPKPVLDCVMNSLSTHDTMRIITALGTEDCQSFSKDERAVYKLPEHLLNKAVEMEKAAAFLQYMLPGSPCIYYGDEAGLEGFEDPFNRRFFPWSDINEHLLSFYKELGHVKTHHCALSIGSIQILLTEEQLFGFVRECGESIMRGIVSLNPDVVECERYEGHPVLSHNCVFSDDRLILGQYGFVLLKHRK